MGGAVAFEVARELDSQGQKVGLVIMVDCLAPRYLQPLAAWQHARSSFQRLLETRERAARTSKQRRRVEAALHEAYDHYRPSPQCVDVLFLTAEAPHGLPPYPDPLLGWGNFLRGRISQCGVTGARARIFAPENLTQLTTRITAALKSAERNRENGVKLAAV
jgi:thioesterase domain-containing protein